MDATKYRLLVVDDWPDWRVTLSGLLEDAGYEVHTAGSLDEALGLLASEHFDLAILDIRLDERNEENTAGLDLAAEIKTRWPKVKVIVITGYGTQHALERAMQPNVQGYRLANDFIPKTETARLPEAVRRVLG